MKTINIHFPVSIFSRLLMCNVKTNAQHNCPQGVTHPMQGPAALSALSHVSLSSGHQPGLWTHPCLVTSLWGIHVDVFWNNPKYHHLQLLKWQNPIAQNHAVLPLILTVPGPCYGLCGVGCLFPISSFALNWDLSIASYAWVSQSHLGK